MTDVDEIVLGLRQNDLNKTDLLKFKKTVEFKDSIKTDILCIEYSDKLLVSISSTGKFGSVLLAKTDKSQGLDNSQTNVIYSIKSLFGQQETILSCFARSLIEKLHTQHSVTKPVLFCISVSKEQLTDQDLFKSYEKHIIESY